MSRRTIKQLFCVHWFDPIIESEDLEYRGAIVCHEQQGYAVTRQHRSCYKCGYSDSRFIKEHYEGWS